MKLVVLLFTLYMLVTSALSLTVYKDCLVKTDDTVEQIWIGSSIDLTVWVPGNSMDFLKLTLHCKRSEKESICHMINISQSNIYWKEVKDGNPGDEGNFNFKEQLGQGWLDFHLSVSRNMVLMDKATKQIILSIPDYPRLEKVTIQGSNVTINCLQQDIGWKVEKNKKVVIPLATNVISHNISLFSNDQVIPHITINNETVKLGWDEQGQTLFDVTKYSGEHSIPLPVSIQHWFTLTCTVDTEICKMEDDAHKVFKTFDNVTTLPTSLTVKVDNEVFIYYHRQTDSHSEAPSAATPDVPDVIGNPQAVVHESGHSFFNTDTGLMAAIAVLSCAVLLLVCIVAVLLKAQLSTAIYRQIQQNGSP